MTDPDDDEQVQGDWHRDEEIAALQCDLKNAQSTRAAAEEHLARLHGEVVRMTAEIASLEAQRENLQRELNDAMEATNDSVRAFKSAMIVIAYLASLL